MANNQPLNNMQHQDVHIITEFHPKYGDNESYAHVVLSELAHAQADYPIFLRQNGENGPLELIAVLGLAEAENLFLDDSGWDAHYIPLSVQRRPFLIGVQQDENNPQGRAVVHIDLASPRVSDSEGQRIFLPEGGNTEFLQQISAALNTLHMGMAATADFVATLNEMQLIDSVSLRADLKDGQKVELGGLFTIHEQNLANLSAENLAKLHQKQYLRAAYMMIASVSNISKLIKRKNERL